MRENRAAFERGRLVPRMLASSVARDLAVSICGTTTPAPIFLAPIGVKAVAHADGEIAVASLIKRAGRRSAARGCFVPATVQYRGEFQAELGRPAVASKHHRSAAGERCVGGEDTRRAFDQGCDGVVVSNHGGRQVDSAIAALDADAVFVGRPYMHGLAVGGQAGVENSKRSNRGEGNVLRAQSIRFS